MNPTTLPMPGKTRSAHETRDRDLFDKIAAAYCRKDLIPACRTARRQRIERTLACVPVGPEISMLEAGCGAGFAATYLDGKYSAYRGEDHSAKLIEYARAHNAGTRASFDVANIKDYNPRRRFDVILMIGVLHHLDEIPLAVRNLIRLLRPGGWLVCNEPQPTNPLIRLARRVRKRIDAQYSNEQIELSAAELRELFARFGLIDIRTRPQGLFSTPFAEVPMGPQPITRSLAKAACLVDTALESMFGRLLQRVTWNVVAAGQKPANAPWTMGKPPDTQGRVERRAVARATTVHT